MITLNNKTNYYASKLNSEFYALYLNCIDSLSKGILTVRGSVTNCPDFQEQAELLYLAIDLGHPELFYISKRYQIGQEGDSLIFNFINAYSDKQIKDLYNELKSEVQRIGDIIAKIKDPYMQLYRLNQYLCIRCDTSSSVSDSVSNAFGALIDRMGRCEAIAKAAKMILDYLGFDNLIAFGTATQDDSEIDHTWNIVNVNGMYYHFDFTWDINLSNEHIAIPLFTFFDDEEISFDHKWKHDYPKCNDRSNIFYIKNKGEISSLFDLGKVYIHQSKKSFFSIVKILNPITGSDAPDTLIELGIDAYNPYSIARNYDMRYLCDRGVVIYYFIN